MGGGERRERALGGSLGHQRLEGRLWWRGEGKTRSCHHSSRSLELSPFNLHPPLKGADTHLMSHWADVQVWAPQSCPLDLYHPEVDGTQPGHKASFPRLPWVPGNLCHKLELWRKDQGRWVQLGGKEAERPRITYAQVSSLPPL